MTWVKSSRSGIGGECVEVRAADGQVHVRDSKLGGASPVLVYTAAAWAEFLRDIRGGDLPHPAYLRLDDGGVDLVQTCDAGTAVLTFTRAEWDAFVAGVEAGEFDVERLDAAEVSA